VETVIIVSLTFRWELLPTSILTNFPPPCHAVQCHQYSVASFATLLVLSCLHSPGLRSSCCNVVRFCCGLEACHQIDDVCYLCFLGCANCNSVFWQTAWRKHVNSARDHYGIHTRTPSLPHIHTQQTGLWGSIIVHFRQ
jgi:hypothetical protein